MHDLGAKKWKLVAARVNHSPRTPAECKLRWNELSKGTGVKKAWTAEEDEAMRAFVATNGPGDWGVVASRLPGRNGKQCRER